MPRSTEPRAGKTRRPAPLNPRLRVGKARPLHGNADAPQRESRALPAVAERARPRDAPTKAVAGSVDSNTGGDRIQKALASAGIASRRAIEGLIQEGRITVNGQIAQLGQKLSPQDRVAINGRLQAWGRKPEAMRVLIYKKRVGEMVTRSDPEGRRTVFKKLPDLETGRWIAVGRLDINTSGLLLLTNHGELARRLTHPSYELTREYAVRTLGEVDEALVKRLTTGVTLEDGPAHFESMKPMDAREYDEEATSRGANRWFHVVVREGRNRLVRRLIESQDLKVSRLIRIAYGPIRLGGGIRSAGFREADREEIDALRAAVKLGAPPSRHKRR